MKIFPLSSPLILAMLIKFIFSINSYYCSIAMPIVTWEFFAAPISEENKAITPRHVAQQSRRVDEPGTLTYCAIRTNSSAIESTTKHTMPCNAFIY